MSGDRVGDKLGRADAKLASFSEVGVRFNRGEKLIRSIDKIRRQSDTGRVSHDRKQSLARSRVVEALDCRS